MQVQVLPDKAALGRAAASAGAAALRRALAQGRQACAILATGASQFEMLAALVREPGVDWQRLRIFHLDEYLGLPASHPASFCHYLHSRVLAHLPAAPLAFVAIDGMANPVAAEIDRLNALLENQTVAVCFAGIGENCHLAFNDPPADFDTQSPFLQVDLDDACRRQQLGEGWFPDLAAVPRRAITMSVRQIAKAQTIILSVPDARKAAAVQAAIEGPLTAQAPASFLQTHADCRIFLDPGSARDLRQTTRAAAAAGVCAGAHDPRLLLLHAQDNVLVARQALAAGTRVRVDGSALTLVQDIARAHKIARSDIAAGAAVLKYAAPIGRARRAISRGEHVHVHNLASDYTPTWVIDASDPSAAGQEPGA